MSQIAIPKFWMPNYGLKKSGWLTRWMAHLKKGADGHLLKGADGHLVNDCTGFPSGYEVGEDCEDCEDPTPLQYSVVLSGHTICWNCMVDGSRSAKLISMSIDNPIILTQESDPCWWASLEESPGAGSGTWRSYGYSPDCSGSSSEYSGIMRAYLDIGGNTAMFTIYWDAPSTRNIFESVRYPIPDCLSFAIPNSITDECYFDDSEATEFGCVKGGTATFTAM